MGSTGLQAEVGSTEISKPWEFDCFDFRDFFPRLFRFLLFGLFFFDGFDAGGACGCLTDGGLAGEFTDVGDDPHSPPDPSSEHSALLGERTAYDDHFQSQEEVLRSYQEVGNTFPALVFGIVALNHTVTAPVV
mmetsp:Transcript_15111/g.19113  ORF Transcript_15111/g.19113 Transcript_15111/m.19113 type:complete len:133 (+) Transcript_15111:407-805(+)